MLAYVAFHFGEPVMDYLRFKDAMKGQSEAAEVNSDAEIRDFLAATAERLEIPLRPRDIQILRTRKAISISARWSEEVVLPKYRRTLHFHPAVSAPLEPEPQ